MCYLEYRKSIIVKQQLTYRPERISNAILTQGRGIFFTHSINSFTSILSVLRSVRVFFHVIIMPISDDTLPIALSPWQYESQEAMGSRLGVITRTNTEITE